MASNFPDFSQLGGDSYEYAGGGAKIPDNTPELLYKMCKKIAQLTKVVYVLNTRNDDLEIQCKTAAEACEEKVANATVELKRTVSHLKSELEKKIDLNERVHGLEETLKQRDQELRKLLDEIASVRQRQEEREKELSGAYRLELRQATEAQKTAERRLAEVLASQEESHRIAVPHRQRPEFQASHSLKMEEVESKDEKKRWSLDNVDTVVVDEEIRRRAEELEDGRKRAREQEVAEFRRLVEQLQRDLQEKTERWEAVAKEERSKLEAQLERAKAAKEDAEKLLSQQLQAESRNLVSQEARYQEKLSELSGQLAARESEANALRLEIEELKRELVAKSSGMDRLQAELASSNKEGECVRQTLRKLEEDVTGFRHKNIELAEELQKKAGEMEALTAEKTRLEEEMSKKKKEESDEEEDDSEEDEDDSEEEGGDGAKERAKVLEEKVKALEGRVAELEGRAVEVEKERDRIAAEKRQLEAEREEEMKIVQEALDGAVEEKKAIQARFERDFEALRTVNTDREQQLLDDFEWKLREVEATCKRRLEEKERAAEERIRKSREEAEATSKVQMQELAALKTQEAELAQLRGLTHEQQRSLRQGSRQIESLQVSEKILQEEVSKLSKLLEREKNNAINSEIAHTKKLSDVERSWSNRLAALRNELNSSWEDRLKKELTRLRNELDRQHTEEKKELEEAATAKSRVERRELDRKLKEALDEISNLKANLESKEGSWKRELEKAQINSDRDIFELRRKLDKLDMSYQDQIEILNGKHHKEIEKLNLEAEQRIAAVEQTWQMQLSSTRTTIELVKEQMERDAQKKVEAVHDEYKIKIDTLWKRLTDDKEKAVMSVEKKFLEQLEHLKEEMQKNNSSAQESEHLLKMVNSLKEELSCKSKVINDLQGNVDALQGGIQVLNEELNTQSKEMEKFQNDAENTLRERESQLEAQRLKDLEALRKAHSDEASKWRKEVQLMRDAFQRKAASLCQMLEEYRRKYEEREPRREDVQLIADLQQALEEKERDLSALTEEKRYYQLELAKHEGGSNCNSEVTIEIPARRRKGCKTDNAHGVSASNARGAKSGRLDTQLVDKGPQVNVCRGSSAGGLATTSRTPPVTLKESSVQPLAARRGSSPALPTRPTGGIYQHPGIEATANNVNDQLPNHNRSRSVDLAFFLPKVTSICAPQVQPSPANNPSSPDSPTPVQLICELLSSNTPLSISKTNSPPKSLDSYNGPTDPHPSDTPLHISEPSTPEGPNIDQRPPVDPVPVMSSPPVFVNCPPELTDMPLESTAATMEIDGLPMPNNPTGASTPGSETNALHSNPLQIVEPQTGSINSSSLLNPPIPVLPDPTPPQ
ncbi:protein FAM184A-like isoform X2 [Hetaerina americana]|uniref:protein FAM184A-like isoform X2 n=1 Tax=Hetaerina americana TaxID=62018 RepID=UPI003A7F2868